jgi:DNA polymerase III alpha subunit
MRHLLRMLRCGTLEETIAAVALIRPGAAESGMKEAFCRRHRGLESVSYLHPRLASVLGGTHGVMLYEEDVMRVASVLAGLSLGEGDDLRRAIGVAGHAPGERSNREQALAALERGFVGRCVANGVAPEPAAAVWRALAQFAGYAFCKAHAAGYGTLGWQTAWLKTHYAAEFAVGVMNHHAGMYATWVHVEDLRRHGVTFRAPCVARSAVDTTLEQGGTVRVGLSRVFGLASATAERILAARAAKPFTSLADFTDRARPTLPELESLILAGALDVTGRTRAALLLEARVGAAQPAATRARARVAADAPALVGPDGADVMPEAVAPVKLPELEELDAVARFHGEFRSTGLWFGAHPLDLLAPAEAFHDTTPAAAIDGLVGKRVSVIGLPCASRTVETKAGAPMLFLTLADRTGLAEAVLFPDAWRRNAASVRGQVVRVEGRVDETLGAVTVTVERATALT